jgi:hypothetical protein
VTFSSDHYMHDSNRSNESEDIQNQAWGSLVRNHNYHFITELHRLQNLLFGGKTINVDATSPIYIRVNIRRALSKRATRLADQLMTIKVPNATKISQVSYPFQDLHRSNGSNIYSETKTLIDSGTYLNY